MLKYIKEVIIERSDEMFHNIVTLTHHLMREKVHKGDHVLDATVGKGNDTLLLSQLVETEGIVYGFDLQSKAIEITSNRLDNESIYKNTKLFNKSHSQLTEFLPQDEKLQFAIFNLGYLPAGDKSIITQAETTVQAIDQTLSLLDKDGLLLIASYVGHPGGMEEFDQVHFHLENLDQKRYNVGVFNFINQKNLPPRLFIVERRS